MMKKIPSLLVVATLAFGIFTALPSAHADAASAPSGAVKPVISVGGTSVLYLRSDDTVWAWGSNSNGQLGIGTTTMSTTPVQIAGVSNVVAVAAGETNAAALASDGTVWAWGAYAGNGATANTLTPRQVNGLSGVTAIAAGGNYTLALKSDGTVWALGKNTYGALGNGTTTDSLAPVAVTGLSGIKSIAAGEYHAAALKSDGTVWDWGANTCGELGDGTTTNSSVPVQVNGLSGAVSVSVGGNTTFAIKSDGTAWGWGRNAFGELGNGTTTSSPTTAPVQVTSFGADVQAIYAGMSSTIAMEFNGMLWGVGSGANGVLGSGGNGYGPAAVNPGTGLYNSGKIAAVSVSINGTGGAAVDSAGNVWVWGYNGYGQLANSQPTANGPSTSSRYPMRVIFPSDDSDTPLPGTVTGVTLNKTMDTIAVGGGDTLTAAVSPAGASDSGVTWSSSNPTVAAVNKSGVVKAVAAGTAIIAATTDDGGYTALCAVTVPAAAGSTNPMVSMGETSALYLKSNGTLIAWGNNSYGQYGDGTTTSSLTNVQVSGLSGVVSVAMGDENAAALKSDGTVWAWGGYNGNGTAAGSLTPEQVSGLSGVVAVAAGGDYTLALKSDGTVWAWGDNTSGAIGDGTVSDCLAPKEVTGLSHIVAIAAGDSHAAAIQSDGTLWDWGTNKYGQLGTGTTTDSYVPVRVSGLSGVVSVALGSFHSVAIKADGTMWAWGWNAFGQLGNGTATDSSVPKQIINISNQVISISCGQNNTLALLPNGILMAWGDNSWGDLGIGAVGPASVPVQVFQGSGVNGSFYTSSSEVALKKASAVSAGGAATVAIDYNGGLWAWGYTGYGQLGNGTTSVTSPPTSAQCQPGIVTFTSAIVMPPYTVNGVSLNKILSTLNVGDADTLTATIYPTGASLSVSWSSSDTSVATVDNAGKVTAVAPGKAVITVTTTQWGFTARCVVKVNTQATWTTVENTDSAVIWSGSDWTAYNSAVYSGGSTQYTSVKNASAQLTFTGTAVQWLGAKSSNRGLANVYIDGALVASNVNCYSATDQFQSVLFSDTDLSPGTHTIRIVALGTKDVSANNCVIDIDAFQIIGTPCAWTGVEDTGLAVTWSGSWTAYSDPRYSGGSTHYTATAGTSAQLTFTGTSVQWIGAKSSNRGLADVYIDGALAESNVNCYSATDQFQCVLFIVNDLSSGTHTIKIVVKGARDSSATGSYIDVDAFDYQ